MVKKNKHSSAAETLEKALSALDIKDKTIEQLKSHALPLLRNWLNIHREEAKTQFMADGDPKHFFSAYTHMIDTLLRNLCSLYTKAYAGQKFPLAIIGVGGYGREELFPYSDIDILFLYEKATAESSADAAQFILYLLWDLNLNIGQSHRSIEEAIQLSLKDITIRTNVLDSRFIVGEQTLFDTFKTRYQNEVMQGRELEFVEAKMAERETRHTRFGDSRYMLEPNVKEGKGGLRDLHTLWWVSCYCYPIKAVKELVGLGLLTQEEYRMFDQSRLFLWRVRIYLHYLAGRSEERLTFDRQHALAIHMGFNHPSANRSIERFMRRYFVAVRTVGTITRVFCALLEEEKKRKPKKPLGWLRNLPWKVGHYRLRGERLNIRSEQALIANPILMIEIFHMAQKHEMDIHPQALQLIGRHLSLVDETLRADPKANALFMEMLLGEHPEKTLGRMSEAGVLGKFISDFGRVVGQTQFNMYHAYTVDEHTLTALCILRSIEKGEARAELPLASDIIHRIQMRRVLYLALFCHDIAKGRNGDHSELGEKIAAKLATRFGFAPEEVATCAWLVLYHLLFSNTAFRRDIDDPKTIQDFIGLVRTPERLKLLLVLTVADIRAVGPSVWNAWKGALLRDLYTRAEQAMGSGQAELKKHQTEHFRQDLLARLAGWKESEVDAYLEQGNAAFMANFDLARHAVIARMTREAQNMDLTLLIDTQHRYEHSITEIIVVTLDQPRLFSKITGALALAGANIINAKIYTLKNGLVVDVFQVQDISGQVFDRSDRLAKMSVYLEQALSEEMDIASAISERKSQFTSPSRDAIPSPAQVIIDNNASNIHSVMEVVGQDRAGFLYDVTNAIAELGLTIATAHISTYGAQVADVFYVKDTFGLKITHEAKLKQIKEVLLKAIVK